MGEKDFLKLGSWNVCCDRCGQKYKGEELQKEWTGLRVCHSCHEPRNQQDFLKGVPDCKPKSYYRPEAVETFVDVSTTPDPYALIP
jgi:hypothetical protein